MAMLRGLGEDCFWWCIPLQRSKYPHKSWIYEIRSILTSIPPPWSTEELGREGMEITW
jgi:hypothetical protein